MRLFGLFNKTGVKMKAVEKELDTFYDALSGNDQLVYPKLKQRIIELLSNDSEVEKYEYSAKKITYTMLTNICNALFVRHRIYPTDFDEDSIVHIWRLAVKNLYDFNEILKTAYKEKINDINDIVQEYISQHKSAFVDDRDDMSNNLLFRGQWWF